MTSTQQQEKVHLTIRCALENFSDYHIECAHDWTVLMLKEHLAEVCDFKPEISRQRLIYAGRCLENGQKISEVLKQHRDGIQRAPDEQLEKQVIHMVYIGGGTPAKNSSNGASNSDGLRHRANAASNSATATSTTAYSPSNFGQQPAHQPVMMNMAAPPMQFGGNAAPQSHEAWMAAYQNYMAQMMQVYQQGATAVPYHQQHNPMMAAMMMQMQPAHLNWGMMQQHQQQYGQPNHHQVPTTNNNQQHQQQVLMGAVAGASPFAVGQQIPGAAAAAAVVQIHQRQAAVAPPQIQAAPMAPLAANQVVRPPPDLLDLVYKSIRFALLAMLLYLYSSLERFIFVFSILAIFWFVRARRGQQQPAGQQRQAEVQQQQPNPLGAQPQPQPDVQQPPAAADGGGVNAVVGTEQPNPMAGGGGGAWAIFFQTVQSFFTSLIPENPAPLDIN